MGLQPLAPFYGILQVTNDIWVLADNSIIAVGGGVFGFKNRGFVARFDGVSWTLESEYSDATLTGVWARSDTDIYAVGSQGTLIHFDGSIWSSVDIPTTLDLTGVFGDSERLYVSAMGGMLELDDGVWSRVEPAPMQLLNVGGKSPDAIFAVGHNGFLAGRSIRRTDSGWVNVPLGAISTGVWASGPDDAWAVGWTGIWRYNSIANAWLKDEYAPSERLVDIWGTGSDNLYATGESGTLLKRDQSGWTRVNSDLLQGLRSIHGVATGRAFLNHGPTDFSFFDGEGVSPFAGGVTTDLWANDDDLAIVTTANGLEVHRDALITRYAFPDEGFLAVAGVSENQAFLGTNDGRAVQFDAGNLNDLGYPGTGNPTAVALVASGVLFGSDAGELYRWSGGNWTDLSPGDGWTVRKLSVGTSGSAVVLTSNPEQGSRVFRLVGDTLTPIGNHAEYLLGLWAAPNGAVWVVGENGAAHFLDQDGNWSRNDIPAAHFFTSVSGTDVTDVITVSGNGSMYHHNGDQWTPVLIPQATYSRVVTTPRTLHLSLTIGGYQQVVRNGPW
jgi:hypothetical protein